jgi:hypothetical protein
MIGVLFFLPQGTEFFGWCDASRRSSTAPQIRFKREGYATRRGGTGAHNRRCDKALS